MKFYWQCLSKSNRKNEDILSAFLPLGLHFDVTNSYKFETNSRQNEVCSDCWIQTHNARAQQTTISPSWPLNSTKWPTTSKSLFSIWRLWYFLFTLFRRFNHSAAGYCEDLNSGTSDSVLNKLRHSAKDPRFTVFSYYLTTKAFCRQLYRSFKWLKPGACQVPFWFSFIPSLYHLATAPKKLYSEVRKVSGETLVLPVLGQTLFGSVLWHPRPCVLI